MGHIEDQGAAPAEQVAAVIPLERPLPRVHRINGIALPLGSMSLDELLRVGEACALRERAAHLEGEIVGHYIAAALPNPDLPDPA